MKKCIYAKMCILIFAIACFPFFVTAREYPQKETVGDEAPVPRGISDSFMKVAESESLLLAVDLDTAIIAVTVRETGYVWYTNPLSLDENDEITDTMRNRLKSQIIVTYMTPERIIATAESYKDSVQNGKYEIRKATGGIKITYDFSDSATRFKIPIQIVLDNDTLACKILYEEIEEYGESKIADIALLPFFGAGHQSEDGYLFIPDGSGALIDFKDNYRNADDYSKPVFGHDPSKDLLLRGKTFEESILMPVFGIKREQNAVFAVLEDGCEDAVIHAHSQQRMSPYTTAYSTFTFRHTDQTGISDREQNFRVTQVISSASSLSAAGLRYYFLQGGQADYNGMAALYRKCLIDTYSLEKLKEESAAASIEFFGMTYKTSYFVGIPYKKTIVATTFLQTQDILHSIIGQADWQTNVILYGFEKGGYDNFNCSEKWDKHLGTKKEFQKLVGSYDNARFYVARNILRDYDSKFLTFRRHQYTVSLGKQTVRRGTHMPNNGLINEKLELWNLFTQKMVQTNATKLLNRVISQYPGIVYSHMGEEISSDFNKGSPKSRKDMLEAYKNVLMESKENLKYSGGENGPIYLLDGVDFIFEVPLACTPNLIFSRSIPFYSMVLHGYVQLSSNAVNDEADIDTALLRGLESGISPTFRLTGNDSKDLANTNLGFLYNSKSELWAKTISEAALRYAELYEGLHNQAIVEHKHVGGLSVTKFESGVEIIVNYGIAPATYKETKISAKSAARID